MDIKIQAHEYALKALEKDVERLENAYIAGYNAASSECQPPIINVDGIEFYDLGMPSGTMWSEPLSYIDAGDVMWLRLPYCEAVKYQIPTFEQVDELYANALYCKDERKWRGANGNEFPMKASIDVWAVNKEGISPHDYKCFDFVGNSTRASFSGNKNLIVLVKNKTEL